MTIQQLEGQNEDLRLPLFDYATILNATNNFGIANKVGEGGFGPVYKVRMCSSFILTLQHFFLIFLCILVFSVISSLFLIKMMHVLANKTINIS